MEELINAAERLGVLPLIAILLGVILYLQVRAWSKTAVIEAQMKAGQATVKGEGEALAYRLARETRDDYNDLNDKLTAVERERNKLQTDFKALETDFSKLQKTADKLQEENTSLTNRIAPLEKQVTEDQAAYKTLESLFAALQTESATVTTSYKAREEEITELKKRIAVLETQVAEYQVTINNLIEELKVSKKPHEVKDVKEIVSPKILEEVEKKKP